MGDGAAVTLAEETPRLLVERLRTGLLITLVAVTLFAVADLLLGTPGGSLHLVRLAQVGIVVAVYAMLRLPALRARSVAIALGGVTAICVTVSATGILRHDVTTTALLLVVLTMTTATLLPWGAGPQLATTVVAGLALACNLQGASGTLANVAYPTLAVVVAFVASVYVAREVEDYRVARQRAEQTSVEEARLAALSDEAEVSAALARVGREMIASLDRPIILERLCRLTTEALGCDCSHTLLWEPAEQAYVPVAGHGDRRGQGEPMRTLAVPGAAIAGLVTRLQRDEVAQVVISVPEGLLSAALFTRNGVSAALCMALRRGEQTLGIHTASYRGQRISLSAKQERIARGIAQIASLALANARLVEELEQASRVKSEFLATMSHELYTPLAVVLGYAELLGAHAHEPQERQEYMSRIMGAGCTLRDLIASSLEIGKIEAGRDEVQLRPVWLVPFWKELGEACARLPCDGDVTLDWSDDVPDVSLVTDAGKLIVVMRNLVGNALKFTERGTVRVTVASHGGALVLRVADTGIGIRREDQEMIFDLFRQTDGAHSRRHGGTGLGLYVARRFVEGLGGRIAVESAPGRGSIFTVTLLPAAAEQPAHPAPTALAG